MYHSISLRTFVEDTYAIENVETTTMTSHKLPTPQLISSFSMSSVNLSLPHGNGTFSASTDWVGWVIDKKVSYRWHAIERKQAVKTLVTLH